jgi:UDP-perosamine 4-acetyltransferase
MRKLVVLGCGGHARVCIDLLQRFDDFELVGCTGILAPEVDPLGLPYLGSDEVLPGLRRAGVTHAFVAIGDNARRAKTLAEARATGFELASAVSVNASISETAHIGSGVAVMAGSVINTGATIGDGAIINTHAMVDHECQIGPTAHIAPGVALAGNVAVGEGALMGIGSCASPGASVGEWSVVGAGAAVITDIPAFATAVGVPARVIRTSRAEGVDAL